MVDDQDRYEWVNLLVLAQPGSRKQRAVKQLLLSDLLRTVSVENAYHTGAL